MADVKKDLTVSSTTDTQEEINLAAGIVADEEAEETSEETTEEAATETEEEKEQEGKSEEKEEESAATEEETEEAETTSESETEEETEEEEVEEEAEKPAVKKKGKWQKRVDKLTAKLSAAEREVQRLKSGAKEEEEAEEEESETEPSKAAVTDRPKRADFKTQEEYEDAVTDWKIDKRDAERAKQAEAAETKKEFDTYISTQDAFKAEHDDYQDVADEMVEKHISIPTAVQVAIVQLNRPDLAYHLAKNLSIIEEMGKVSQTRAVAMLGKIMAELDSKTSTSGSKPSKVATKVAATETPKKKTAPTATTTPIKIVKSSSAKSSKLPLDDPKVPFDEYKRRRAAGES